MGSKIRISQLELTSDQKARVLEYLAVKLTDVIFAVTGDSGCCKHYDPLTIIGKDRCLSYCFDFEDGGRQHKFRNLNHLEEMLIREVVEELRD